MKTLTAYLFKDMVRPSLAALFIMLSIIWLMQSLRFMDLIINKGLDISTFLWITMLIVPSLLIIVLPLSLFAGTCYSFKRLNDDNELSPLFNAGISRKRVVFPALILATTVSIFCYILTLWLMPAGMSSFKNIQHHLRQSGGNLLLEEGTFNTMGNGLTVYVKNRTKNNELHSLLVHDNRKEDRPVTWMAKNGKITFSTDGYPRLRLIEGIRQEITSERLSVLEFAEHTIDITKQINVEGTRIKGSEERYIGELFIYDGIPERDIPKFKAEVQKRLIWPLTSFPVVLFAAIFLVRSKRNRLGSSKPTAIASTFTVLYITAMMMLHNTAAKGNELVLYGQWALPTLVTGICLLLLLDFKKGTQDVA